MKLSTEHIRFRAEMYIGRLSDGKNYHDGILTFNGGTHERAVRSGLMAAMKELNPHITDNQIMLKGLMLVLSIHTEDLWFESATYCKLASSYRDKAHQQPIHDELRRMAKDGVKELYMTNPDFRTFIEQLHDNSYSHS